MKVLRLIAISVFLLASASAQVTVSCGNVDDSLAWQDALNQLAAQGGGTLEVATPCRIASKVSKNFHRVASSVTIHGHGSAAIVTLATGGQVDALSIHGLDQLVFDNLVFAGTDNDLSDVRNGLLLHSITLVVIRNSIFYGLNSHDSYRSGIVKVDSSAGWTDLLIEDSAFLGTFGASANQTAVVSVNNYRNLTVRNTKFLDWGIVNDSYRSKSLSAASYAWIIAFDPRAEDERGDAFSKSGIYIDNCVFDEGGYVSIFNYPAPGKRTRNVEVTNSAFNVGISAGVLVMRAKNFRAQNLWFGWRRAAVANSAIDIEDVENAEVINSDYAPGTSGNILFADADTRFLNVVNSNLVLQSRAQTTCVTVRATRNCSRPRIKQEVL